MKNNSSILALFLYAGGALFAMEKDVPSSRAVESEEKLFVLTGIFKELRPFLSLENIQAIKDLFSFDQTKQMYTVKDQEVFDEILAVCAAIAKRDRISDMDALVLRHIFSFLSDIGFEILLRESTESPSSKPLDKEVLEALGLADICDDLSDTPIIQRAAGSDPAWKKIKDERRGREFSLFKFLVRAFVANDYRAMHVAFINAIDDFLETDQLEIPSFAGSLPVATALVPFITKEKAAEFLKEASTLVTTSAQTFELANFISAVQTHILPLCVGKKDIAQLLERPVRSAPFFYARFYKNWHLAQLYEKTFENPTLSADLILLFFTIKNSFPLSNVENELLHQVLFNTGEVRVSERYSSSIIDLAFLFALMRNDLKQVRRLSFLETVPVEIPQAELTEEQACQYLFSMNLLKLAFRTHNKAIIEIIAARIPLKLCSLDRFFGLLTYIDTQCSSFLERNSLDAFIEKLISQYARIMNTDAQKLAKQYRRHKKKESKK
jgi:hypothetical protein